MEKQFKSIVLESNSEEQRFRNSYLHLHSIGVDISENHKFSRPSCLTDYLFTLILEGGGYYSKEKEAKIEYSFEQGDLIVLKPDEYFHIRSNGKLKRTWFHVLGTAIPEILTNIAFDAKHQKINLPATTCKIMAEVFEDLYFIAKQNSYNSIKLNALMLTFFSYATYNSITDIVPENISQSLEYINSNYRQDIQIETLANMTHLNPYYYIKQFKKVYGVTPYQYILRKRFNAATSELANTNWTIDEIAFRNKFSNRVHFSQMFKKHYGITPTEYRKQYH